MISCNWCQQNEAKYELVIYRLREDESHVTNGERRIQIIRDEKYLSVRLCKMCLPVTTPEEYVKELTQNSKIEKKKKIISGDQLL